MLLTTGTVTSARLMVETVAGGSPASIRAGGPNLLCAVFPRSLEARPDRSGRNPNSGRICCARAAVPEDSPGAGQRTDVGPFLRPLAADSADDRSGCFPVFTRCMGQSETDAERLRLLGAEKRDLSGEPETCGSAASRRPRRADRSQGGHRWLARYWLAASTHPRRGGDLRAGPCRSFRPSSRTF